MIFVVNLFVRNLLAITVCGGVLLPVFWLLIPLSAISVGREFMRSFSEDVTRFKQLLLISRRSKLGPVALVALLLTEVYFFLVGCNHSSRLYSLHSVLALLGLFVVTVLYVGDLRVTLSNLWGVRSSLATLLASSIVSVSCVFTGLRFNVLNVILSGSSPLLSELIMTPVIVSLGLVVVGVSFTLTVYSFSVGRKTMFIRHRRSL
jgi:hypothetical protein